MEQDTETYTMLWDGQDVQKTFTEMLNVLNMTYEEYIKAVRTVVVTPKWFLNDDLVKSESKTMCSTTLNCGEKIMKKPSLDPFGVIQDVFSCVTKGQKGMSVLV